MVVDLLYEFDHIGSEFRVKMSVGKDYPLNAIRLQEIVSSVA